MPNAEHSSPQAQKRRAAATREKVQAHRDRMRAQGFRLVQLWVPDTHNPTFAATLRRQVARLNRDKSRADDDLWIDAVSDWSWVK